MIEDFLHLYSNTPVGQKKKGCIIMQNNVCKIVWDLWILLVLLVISLVVPYRLAFATSESYSWTVVYVTTDILFFIDIILTFFTSVSDEQKVYDITDRCEIAKRYLKGWFWIDVLSILPLDIIFLD